MGLRRPDRLDAAAVGLPEVVGEAVDRDRLDGSRDPAGRLEAKREDTDQEVARLAQLALREGRLARRLEQPDQLPDRTAP